MLHALGLGITLNSIDFLLNDIQYYLQFKIEMYLQKNSYVYARDHYNYKL